MNQACAGGTHSAQLRRGGQQLATDTSPQSNSKHQPRQCVMRVTERLVRASIQLGVQLVEAGRLLVGLRECGEPASS